MPGALLRARSPVGRPGLAAVSLGSPDGIGYAGALLATALEDLVGRPPWVATVEPAASHEVSVRERLQFALRIALGQLARKADWMIYTHVGIARAHRALPSRLRLPYAVFVHGIEVWGDAMDASKRATLRGARLRLSNSGYTAGRLMREHPDIGPVVPCPLALLPGNTVTGALDAGLLERVGPRAALIVGRMSVSERYKGHDELLESWPRVLRAVPDAQLVIVGRGNDVERLRAKAASLGIGDAVLFSGFASDATVAALLDRVALFTMPSRGEGFGLVYLQAMRHARPVIASVHDAAGDVVLDGETGLLVDHDDRAALADAVATLLTDPARARRYGEAGRRRLDDQFTFARFRDRLGGILAEAFGSARPA